MQITVRSRRRGNILAFVLMGIIALLAIALVLFSRARREGNPEPAPHIDAPQTLTAPAEPPSAVDSVTTTPDILTNEATAPAAIQTPPPAPPVTTPDTRDLPPEA